MKRIFISMVAVILLATSAGASQIQWANDSEIYDWSGSGHLVLDSYTSYNVGLYKSVDVGIEFGLVGGIATNYSDDTWTGYEFSWNSQGADGFGADIVFFSDTTWGILPGDKIYSVIFTDMITTSGTATNGYFAVIDDALATVNYTAGNMVYDPGGVNSGLVGGGWQVVPEPATALLFGIGGMGAWLFRRSKLKSKEESDA